MTIGRNSDSAVNYKGNDTNLNLDAGTADEYAGLDQFGRVIRQLLTDSDDGSVVRSDADYEANRDGSPKFAEQQSDVVLGRGSLYSYDNLSSVGCALPTSWLRGPQRSKRASAA